MDPQKIVYYGPEDLRPEPQDRPEISRGEVLVEVEACAICGSDIKTYVNGNPRIAPPNTMGHEFCGRIVEVADGVDNYRVDQRVTMATTIGCGECACCRRGRTNLCPSLQATGFHFPGAMARWVRIPSLAVRQRHLIPVGNLEADVAALSEPLSCAVNNLQQVPMKQVKNAAVIGLGPLGLMHTILLRQMGVESVIGVQSAGKRQAMAKQFDMRAVVTPEEFSANFKDMTGGEGFDLVVVTAPSNAAQADAVRYASKGGYVSLFASLPVGLETLSVNSRTIHYNELHVYGCSDSTGVHVALAVEQLRAQPGVFARLITGRYPLDRITEAIQRIQSRDEMKVVLFPGNGKDDK